MRVHVDQAVVAKDRAVEARDETHASHVGRQRVDVVDAGAQPDDGVGRLIEEYREAGCTHVMLELWGANRHDQIRLFGERVLPHFRQ